MNAQIGSWLRERLGIPENRSSEFDQDVPPGVGWAQTLGAVLVALILVQVVTGVFMAMYYSPHPDGAYDSTYYLRNHVPGGKLLYSLHHYCDSALIAVLGLHLVSTLVRGAYKRPRELSWLLGIIALNIVVIFGVTGHLLPWDQKGVRSTEVRSSFPADVPIVGPYIKQILLGGPDIGALSLTRFYALHALLLPALLLAVVAIHGRLALRHGPAPATPVGSPPERAGKWSSVLLPRQLIAAGVAVLALIALSLFKPAELEFRYDTADTGYKARPDWYFLFLFQFLNDASKLPLKIPSWMLALGVPGAVMTFLALAPWIDRSPERKLARRPLMLAVLVVLGLAVGGFTARAMTTLHPNATPEDSVYGHLTKGGEEELNPAQVQAGKMAFGNVKPVPCSACHKAYADFKVGTSPDLSGIGRHTLLNEVTGHPNVGEMSFYERFKAYVRGDLRPKDASGQEKSMMPKYPVESLSDVDLNAIAAYLSQDPLLLDRQRRLGL